MDYSRVFILHIPEIRRRYWALESITATRCVHETTALFYRTSACFIIVLKNSTSNWVLKYVHLFLHATQNSSGLVISFEVQQYLSNNCIVQYLYLLTSRLRKVCPDIRVRFIYFIVTRVYCVCIDRCVSVASVVWLRYFYGRHHVALTRRPDSLATFFSPPGILLFLHSTSFSGTRDFCCPALFAVPSYWSSNSQATFVIELTDLITSSFDTKLSRV